MNKIRFFIAWICICSTGFSTLAQTLITGTVIDSASKEPLPFVNIGIKHKNTGTVSAANGSFSLTIPQDYINDSLTFSMVGYTDVPFIIKDIHSSDQHTFLLPASAKQLKEVVVSAKLTEKKYGIKNQKSLIHFTDGSTNQNDIFEIAQLIKLDTLLSKIVSVNLYVSEARDDSGTFRINFYSYEGNKPANRIIEKNITQTLAIKQGWLTFDIRPYSVYLKGNFAVSIEFIPSPAKTKPIYYEVKLGGSAKSFVRTNSQGDWHTPPHHYRLYVTALVPVTKKNLKEDDSEEQETIASRQLYSQFVQDTFSLFVHLPKGYNEKSKKRYPVVYLLDANAYFDIISNALKENNFSASPVLIGIGYKDFIQNDSLRQRDYTYPVALPQDSFPVSGGGYKFLSFIEEELIPFIDKNYHTDTLNRTIMGHSLGGFFTLFALKENLRNKTDYFKNYVAASPSIYYSNQYLLHEFENITIDSINDPVTLYLGVGQREIDRSNAESSDAAAEYNSFINELSRKKPGIIKITSEIFPGYEHMDTPVPGFTNALKLIFKN